MGPIFTENVIAGVTTSFLFAGLESVSATTTFCLYELVRHPEMQERLCEEIQSARKESGGDIKYEDLKKLRYLDQVVNAQRLALMDVKTMVITLVSGYTLHTCSKTADHISKWTRKGLP